MKDLIITVSHGLQFIKVRITYFLFSSNNRTAVFNTQSQVWLPLVATQLHYNRWRDKIYLCIVSSLCGDNILDFLHFADKMSYVT